MKGRNLFIIALLVLVAGVALVILQHTVKATGVVITGGVLFILAGLFNLAVFMGERRGGNATGGAFSSALSWIASVAAVILGLSMLIFQSTFATLVAFMFGVLIAFAALYQFFLLGFGCRPAVLPGWLFVIPTALTGAAIYLFVRRADALPDNVVILITGISLIVFGAATLVESVLIGKYNRGVLRAQKEKTEDAKVRPTEPADAGAAHSNPSHDAE